MWYLYKGKIPFKCFECGKIGHFASKFPYNKIKDNDELKNIIITMKEGRCTKEENRKRFNRKKKSLYYNVNNISSNEYDSDNDTK